jgi:predicted homoserine dehydrogenase-like protein
VGIWRRMEAWALAGNEAQVAVVGTGFVGRRLVQRLNRSPGMRTALVVNRTSSTAVRALEDAGNDPHQILVSGGGRAERAGAPREYTLRDLEAGDRLDGIGGFTCYGQIDTVERAEGLLPIGLSEHARLVRRVRRDDPIPLDAVEIDDRATIVELRRQDGLTSGARDVTAAAVGP